MVQLIRLGVLRNMGASCNMTSLSLCYQTDKLQILPPITSLNIYVQSSLHNHLNPRINVMQSVTLTYLANSPNQHFSYKFGLVDIEMYRDFH